jgi:hypothetical protein
MLGHLTKGILIASGRPGEDALGKVLGIEVGQLGEEGLSLPLGRKGLGVPLLWGEITHGLYVPVFRLAIGVYKNCHGDPFLLKKRESGVYNKSLPANKGKI